MSIATQFTITHSCGHQQDHDLSQLPAGKRLGRVSWLESKPCIDCFKKASKKEWVKQQRQVESEEISVFETKAGLEQLTGSVKQVSWAREVRMRLLQSAFESLVPGSLNEQDFENDIGDPARAVLTVKWWIDYRDIDVSDLAEALSTAVDSGDATENPL